LVFQGRSGASRIGCVGLATGHGSAASSTIYPDGAWHGVVADITSFEVRIKAGGGAVTGDITTTVYKLLREA